MSIMSGMMHLEVSASAQHQTHCELGPDARSTVSLARSLHTPDILISCECCIVQAPAGSCSLTTAAQPMSIIQVPNIPEACKRR